MRAVEKRSTITRFSIFDFRFWIEASLRFRHDATPNPKSKIRNQKFVPVLLDQSQGLTLVELVVGITLSAILGIAVGVLVSEHLRAALRVRDMTVAMSLARAELERLDSLDSVAGQENTTGFCHPDLNVTGASGVTVSSLGGPSYVVVRIVTCQTGNCASNCASASNANNGIKRIEIRVTKTSAVGERVAYLVTYRTKFVVFGT